MRNELSLGSAPYDESCAQVGEKNYSERARFECSLYKEKLLNLIWKEGYEDADICTQSQYHDFGEYLELCIVFESTNQEEVDMAFWLDSNLPSNWDEGEKKQLENFLQTLNKK